MLTKETIRYSLCVLASFLCAACSLASLPNCLAVIVYTYKTWVDFYDLPQAHITDLKIRLTHRCESSRGLESRRFTAVDLESLCRRKRQEFRSET